MLLTAKKVGSPRSPAAQVTDAICRSHEEWRRYGRCVIPERPLIAALRVAPTWNRESGARPAIARLLVPALDTPRVWIWLWQVGLLAVLSVLIAFDATNGMRFGMFVIPLSVLVYTVSAARARRVLLRDFASKVV